MNTNRTGDRHRSSRVRRGASTVEIALCAPFIFFLVFGSLEFSRMMMIRQALTNASREACRNACLVSTQSNNSPDETARQWLSGIIIDHNDSDIVRVEITPEITETTAAGTEITTTIEVDCADVSWLPPFFFADAKISGQSIMTRD